MSIKEKTTRNEAIIGYMSMNMCLYKNSLVFKTRGGFDASTQQLAPLMSCFQCICLDGGKATHYHLARSAT